MANMDSQAGSEVGRRPKSDVKKSCIDCIYWYRCKSGTIDCELEPR